MQVIIDNRRFPYEIGLRILKAKHGVCRFPVLEKCWNDIPDLTIGAIVRDLQDVELRRTAFRHLGLERMTSQLRPQSVGTETLMKTTSHIEADGSVVQRIYEDTYELFRVQWMDLYRGIDLESSGLRASGMMENRYFVKFHCPSTSRSHSIWVDIRQVYRANVGPEGLQASKELSVLRLERLVNPVMAIAWTFVTDLAEGEISAIVRQGDCVIFRTGPDPKRISGQRHLTEREYRTLMRAES